MFGHVLMGMDTSIMSMFSLVTLTGIVVKVRLSTLQSLPVLQTLPHGQSAVYRGWHKPRHG